MPKFDKSIKNWSDLSNLTTAFYRTLGIVGMLGVAVFGIAIFSSRGNADADRMAALDIRQREHTVALGVLDERVEAIERHNTDGEETSVFSSGGSSGGW